MCIFNNTLLYALRAGLALLAAKLNGYAPIGCGAIIQNALMRSVKTIE